MNKAQWAAVAKPVAENTHAVLGEFLLDPDLGQFPELRARLRVAAQAHDIVALRQVSKEIRAEAYRMMAARRQQRAGYNVNRPQEGAA